jgi:hypothetical protein
VLYAALGIGYNVVSMVVTASAGRGLSHTNPVTSIVSLLIYILALIPGFLGRLTIYRILAFASILVFGYDGVLTHILRYPNLESYYSPATWAVAIAINAFGLILNIMAAAGIFQNDREKVLAA